MSAMVTGVSESIIVRPGWADNAMPSVESEYLAAIDMHLVLVTTSTSDNSRMCNTKRAVNSPEMLRWS